MPVWSLPNRALEYISPSEFVKNVTDLGSQLQVSHDSATICNLIQENCGPVTPARVWINGEPGSGRTTLVHCICQELISQGFVNESGILYIDVKPGCDKYSVYSLISTIARDKQDAKTASLLQQASVKPAKKDKALQLFIKENFKLICIDKSGSCDDGLLSDFLSIWGAEEMPPVPIIAVSTQNFASQLQDFGMEVVRITGIKEQYAKELLRATRLPLNDSEAENICRCLSGNPVAIRLFVHYCAEFNLAKQDIAQSIDILYDDCQTGQSRGAVDAIYGLILSHLDPSLKAVLRQCLLLRKPLPLVKLPEEVELLIRLTLLVNTQVSSPSQSAINLISMATSLWGKEPGVEPEACAISFNILYSWMGLLSKELQELLADAKDNAWPFVPEKWQYTEQVGAEQSYNIKEMITAKNSVVPFMTELDILQECIFHALHSKDYNTVAALVFLTDRFAYWQGSAANSLRVVDYLQAESPETPIAPQLIIRKARLMKNQGDLQGAEQTLDRLLQAKTELGKWRYREAHDHQLVSAVCVQIKGDIQYSLGQWLDGAKLLLQSITLFRSLPKMDKKGLSSSLGILAKCFQNVSLGEYGSLAPSYGLHAGHPLLEAYECAKEAARLSQYTPLFVARHMCNAGQFLLEYSRLHPDERTQYLQQAARDLKDSIQSHATLDSLASREQFHVFVNALYQISLSYQESANRRDREEGELLEAAVTQLYEHYCSSSSSVVLDRRIAGLIARCLDMLGLRQFSGSDSDSTERDLTGDAGELSPVLASAKNSPGLNTVMKDDGISVDRSAVTVDSEDARSAPSSLVDRSALTADSEEACSALSSSVDRSAITKESEEARSVPNSSVDRSAVTVDSEENHSVPSSSVDRSAVTVDSEETLSVPSSSVDRSAVTVDSEEAHSMPGFSVDRAAVTKDSEEARSSVGLHHTANEQRYRVIERSTRVHNAVIWKYQLYSKNVQRSTWRKEKSLAFIGDLLQLKKGKEGAQRDAFMAEFIGQEDPMAKYVAKSYRVAKGLQQYKQDVSCQMTARYYVTLFNQRIYQAGLNFGQVQFLPVALLQLLDHSSQETGVYNVEPYMAGEFVKLTNNLDDVRRDRKGADLLLAFSHFTFQASNQELIIVDIQGWTPKDSSGCTFLTDPQIHSKVYNCFGTGNLRQRGFDQFWEKMHPICNNICISLGLVRPDCTSNLHQGKQ